MDKQKQIEKLYDDITERLVGVLSCETMSVAIHLHRLGYRKIPEDAVVLTIKQYENIAAPPSLKETDETFSFHIILDVVRKVERKETAEKFAEMAKAKAIKARVNIDDHPRNDSFIFLSDIDEICKEITGGKE